MSKSPTKKDKGWRKINSSNLKAAKYLQQTNTMVIEFHSGGTYKYQPVPEEVFLEIVDKATESPGQIFAEKIRKNPKITAIKISE